MSNGNITINPNQPLPVVLSSQFCPPPVWPLPVANWVSLPTVAEGFPAGPFTPSYTGPVGDPSNFTPLSPCPGTGLVVAPASEPPVLPTDTLAIESQARAWREPPRRVQRGAPPMPRNEQREDVVRQEAPREDPSRYGAE